MEVKITYHDTEAFTVGEVIKQAKYNYGEAAKVEVYPDSNLAYDYIYFGLQQLMTADQISFRYDSGGSYKQDVAKRKAEIMFKVGEILDSVIFDNDVKLEKE